ncbi:MAG TPA: helix-turn-helix domain-containing protein [Gemmobacter sp.]|nr:helix-turn-helix domain-containing protein [Gemmobacter sp.]
MSPETNAQKTLSQLGANVLAAECPSRQVLSHLTSRWGTLVMLVLLTGTHRFSALRRRIGGVSERMLAQTLQQLESDGFVHRQVYDVVPPHVEYSLTPLGREAGAHLAALTGWIEDALPRILARQPTPTTSSQASQPQAVRGNGEQDRGGAPKRRPSQHPDFVVAP